MTPEASPVESGLGPALRLLLVLPSLGGGGAERAAVDLVRGLNGQQVDITLALFSASGRFLPQVPQGVRVVDLRGRPSYDLRLVWRLARQMRQDQPQVVLSILRYANLITLLAMRLANVGTKVIVNEQNLPSAEFALFGGGAIKRRSLQWLYPQADQLTAISHGIASELSALCHLPEHKVKVIPNPVDLERITRLAAVRPEHPWFGAGQPIIVAAGRLHPQKGFLHLIRAFARVRQSVACKLAILGEGPQRTELEHLISQLGLTSDVALPGFQDNPYGYMAHATVFVLSSLYEGFGNVLVEALAVGAPVISTRCPVGPDEILVDGRTGILVPPADEGALAEAVLRLLKDEGLRRSLSTAGQQRAKDFSLERIVAQYQELIATVARGDSPCAS